MAIICTDCGLDKSGELVHICLRMKPAKGTAEMHNCTLIRHGSHWYLQGNIRNHHQEKNFEGGHSGYLLSIDFNDNSAETNNTHWLIKSWQ